jgi:telomere length regulation protein
MLLDMIGTAAIQFLCTYLGKMKVFEQRKYLNAIITFIVKDCFGPTLEIKEDTPIKITPRISNAASLIHRLVKNNDVLKEHLVSSLTKSVVPVLNDSVSARRSVIAAIAQDEGKCTF